MFKINPAKNEGIGYLFFQIINFIIIVGIVIVMICPFLNVLAKALNDGQDAIRGGIYFWPRVFTLDNFKVLLTDKSMLRALFISISRVIVVVVLSIIIQFMTAYALSKRELKGLKVINVIFLIPMFISGGLIPKYVLMSKIGLLNSFWTYVFPGLFGYYNVIVIRSYMESSIPRSIIEAAQVDGLKEMGILMKIVMPLSKPILATIALWIAVDNWNDWTTTLYYITKSDLYTLQYKLVQTIKETERMRALIQEAAMMGQDTEALRNSSVSITTDSVTNAQTILVSLPIIIIYPFIQKYFASGITLGAVKG